MFKEVKITPLIETIKLLNISDEEYFGEKYNDYISNSRLKLINPKQGGSPELYFKGLEPVFSDAMYFGSCVHQMILQPDEFYIVDSVDRPTAKLGFMADELYKYYVLGGVCVEDIIEASNKVNYFKGKLDDVKIANVFEKCTPYWEDRKKWEEKQYDKSHIYLDLKSRTKLKLCIESLNKNRKIQKLLNPEYIIDKPKSYNEHVLLMDILVEFNGKSKVLSLKAKLDNFTLNTEINELVLNDLKTTGHWLDKFKDSFQGYFYGRQMAMYMWMLKLYVNNVLKINPSLKANMMVVSTIPNYFSGIYQVNNRQMKEGFDEFIELLKMVAYYELTNT